MQPVHIPDTSTSGPRMMDCCCHLHMQTLHNSCSKFPPYAVNYDAVLLIFWYLKGPCRKKVHYDTCFMKFLLFFCGPQNTYVKYGLFQKHPVQSPIPLPRVKCLICILPIVIMLRIILIFVEFIPSSFSRDCLRLTSRSHCDSLFVIMYMFIYRRFILLDHLYLNWFNL